MSFDHDPFGPSDSQINEARVNEQIRTETRIFGKPKSSFTSSQINAARNSDPMGMHDVNPFEAHGSNILGGLNSIGALRGGEIELVLTFVLLCVVPLCYNDWLKQKEIDLSSKNKTAQIERLQRVPPMSEVAKVAKEVCQKHMEDEIRIVTPKILMEADKIYNKAGYHGKAEVLAAYSYNLPYYTNFSESHIIQYSSQANGSKQVMSFSKDMKVLYSARKLTSAETNKFASGTRLDRHGLLAFELEVAVRYKNSDKEFSNYQYDAHTEKRVVLFSGSKKEALKL